VFAANWAFPPVGTAYYNQSGELGFAGTDWAILGGVTAPWHAPAEFLSIGFFNNFVPTGETPPFMWRSDMESYNAFLDNFTTYDGGAFVGRTAGLMEAIDMDGAIALIYIDPDQTAGILRGPTMGFHDEVSGMFLTRGTLVPRPVVPTTILPTDLHSSINDALGAEPDDIDIQDFSFNPQGIDLVATVTPAPIALDPDPTGSSDPQPWGVMDFQIQTYPNSEGAYNNPGGHLQLAALDDDFRLDFGGDFNWGYGGYGSIIEGVVLEAFDDAINESLVGRYMEAEINMDELTLFSARGQFFGRYDGSDMSMSATGVGTWFETDLEGLFYWGDPFGETASLYSYDLTPVGSDLGHVGIGVIEPHIRLGVVLGAAFYGKSGGPGSDAFMWRTVTSDAVPTSRLMKSTGWMTRRLNTPNAIRRINPSSESLKATGSRVPHFRLANTFMFTI